MSTAARPVAREACGFEPALPHAQSVGSAQRAALTVPTERRQVVAVLFGRPALRDHAPDRALTHIDLPAALPGIDRQSTEAETEYRVSAPQAPEAYRAGSTPEPLRPSFPGMDAGP